MRTTELLEYLYNSSLPRDRALRPSTGVAWDRTGAGRHLANTFRISCLAGSYGFVQMDNEGFKITHYRRLIW